MRGRACKLCTKLWVICWTILNRNPLQKYLHYSFHFEFFGPLNPTIATNKHTLHAQNTFISTRKEINLLLINTVGTLFQSQCYSFYVKQQNMSQLLIYVVKKGKDFVFLWRSMSVCVCAQHQNLVWLCAMQLEAIIEPITFCLLLSLFSSFLSFFVVYLISLLPLILSVCLILILQAWLCFTVNPFSHNFSSSHRSVHPAPPSSPNEFLCKLDLILIIASTGVPHKLFFMHFLFFWHEQREETSTSTDYWLCT